MPVGLAAILRWLNSDHDSCQRTSPGASVSLNTLRSQTYFLPKASNWTHITSTNLIIGLSKIPKSAKFYSDLRISVRNYAMIYAFDLVFHYSFGTFGFWSAYLKGQGDVILDSGTSPVPTLIETFIRNSLTRWKFIQDPCFQRDQRGKVQLVQDCADLA